MLCGLMAFGCGDHPDSGSGPETTAGTSDSSVGTDTSDTSTTSTSTSGPMTEDGESSDATQTGEPDPPTYFGDPRCEGADFVVCESFEAAPIDGVPQGWGPRPGGWGGNVMGVAADDSARGGQSFKVQGGETGAQWLQYLGDMNALAGAHWGRMFFKIQTPAPVPGSGVLHGDLFEARGPFAGGTNRVRWGTVGNVDGFFQWIYNVQRDGDEFASGTQYVHQWTGEWVCMQWHHDEATQTATLWLDEVEITDITQSAATNPEIPAFDDISVGWANYQMADPQFVVWIDEVVLNDAPVSCFD